MARLTGSASDLDRMIICKSTQNSHMYKCCLVILRHFVETTKVVGTGQWGINWINHYHHSSKEKTKQLQHTQSSWIQREWSRIKPRLGPAWFSGRWCVKNLQSLTEVLVHSFQTLKFLFINTMEGHFGLLACLLSICVRLFSYK